VCVVCVFVLNECVYSVSWVGVLGRVGLGFLWSGEVEGGVLQLMFVIVYGSARICVVLVI